MPRRWKFFCRRTDGRLGDAGSGKSPVCLTMRRHGAKNADYRGGVTCLYDTQLLGACLHASGCGGRSRPEGVRGMPEIPMAPPATGPPEGWAAVGFVSPASFNRGLWARLLRVLGSLPLILGSERVRIWVFDRFNPGLIRCQNRLADGHKSFIPKRLDCVP